jgi:arylsulfatase A-like enzyme
MRLQSIVAATIVAISSISAHAAPNVLLIIADDMGIDASPCYSMGNQQAEMPNLSAMCAKGMVFDNAYAAPVCSPTRASIMTGQYGFRTGIGSAIPRKGNGGLSTDVTSLFDVLAKTNYSANLIGKWHLADGGDGLDHPAKLGVPDYFGLYSGGTKDYSNWQAVSDGKRVDVDEYATTAFTNRAIDWIGDQTKPWFLWLAYNAPHAPFHIPPSDLHTADDLGNSKSAIRSNPTPYYNAMLQAMDTEIGRLMSSMSRSVRDNTIVIFMGDNGTPNQVARGRYGDHAAKGTIYEGGTHVPFVVSGPGVKTGRNDGFIYSADLFSTIASLAGKSVKTTDSFDFSAMLSGGKGQRDYVYVEHFSDQEAKGRTVYGWAMRQGDHKLVQADGVKPELYNLADDPKETTNLLANGISTSHAEIVEKLRDKYAEIQK